MKNFNLQLSFLIKHVSLSLSRSLSLTPSLFFSHTQTHTHNLACQKNFFHFFSIFSFHRSWQFWHSLRHLDILFETEEEAISRDYCGLFLKLNIWDPKYLSAHFSDVTDGLICGPRANQDWFVSKTQIRKGEFNPLKIMQMCECVCKLSVLHCGW